MLEFLNDKENSFIVFFFNSIYYNVLIHSESLLRVLQEDRAIILAFTHLYDENVLSVQELGIKRFAPVNLKDQEDLFHPLNELLICMKYLFLLLL